MLESLGTAGIVLVAALAAWSDVRTAKIPNQITVGALVLGLALAAAGGTATLASSLQATGVALVFGVLLFAGRVLGGGDCKLLIGLAPLLGMERLVPALVLAALAGAALSVGVAVRRGILLPALLNSRSMVVGWLSPGGGAPAATSGVYVPYGVAIAAGAIGAWFL